MSATPPTTGTEPHWLTDLEQQAWRGFLAMQVAIDARIRRSLAANSGLSDADYAVLVNLSESPEDRLRVFELVRRLQWEKSRLSHQLRRMERRGLVERTECPTDGRGAFVGLTVEGRRVITEAAPLHVAEVRRSFADVLDENRLRSLVDISETVLAALEEDPP